jgi:hypothetical protein
MMGWKKLLKVIFERALTESERSEQYCDSLVHDLVVNTGTEVKLRTNLGHIISG